jgi:hypothetical protein
MLARSAQEPPNQSRTPVQHGSGSGLRNRTANCSVLQHFPLKCSSPWIQTFATNKTWQAAFRPLSPSSTESSPEKSFKSAVPTESLTYLFTRALVIFVG